MWMNGNRNDDEGKIDDEMLNRFSDELLRAFEASDAEINTAAASPFLYRRIRVRIEAEERRLAEQRGGWMALLAGVKRAIPVMVMLAVVAFASLLIMPGLTRGSGEEPPSLMSDVFSFSQDELVVSAAGFGAGHSNQNGQDSQLGGQR
jgi:hypothetical protein